MVSLSPVDLKHIKDIVIQGYADSTRESYGSGLLVFHVFCDSKTIPEDQRAPASRVLISSFISCMAGHYSGKTVSNYVHGVRAWHVVHGVKWILRDAETDTLLKAAIALTPSTSKCSKRQPYTIDLITAIRSQLDLSSPIDAAVFSCLTTTFFAMARTGEFTIPRLDAFNPEIHIKPSDARDVQDRQGIVTKNFHLPRTKTALDGEDVFWGKQQGLSDPDEAFTNHLLINQPPINGPLFAYRFKDTHRPLTKSKLLARLAQATKGAGREPVQGHGIRIGGTLEYLLRNVPFDVVKAKGRWASDAFLTYLRDHAQIMAPFMQGVSPVHEQLLRYTMPPVR